MTTALTEQDLSVPVVAIDGYAGSGKGTARDNVARELGFNQLDSGLLYRAVGLKAQESKRFETDFLIEIALTLQLRVEGDAAFLDGRDRSDDLRSEEAGGHAKVVAKLQPVRDALLRYQLDMRRLPGLVADGRDQCDVFDTPHRFFLRASDEVCAERRVNQLRARGKEADYFETLEGIIRRNEEDRNRSVAPLKPHPHAIIIDTDHMNQQQVAAEIIRWYWMRQ